MIAAPSDNIPTVSSASDRRLYPPEPLRQPRERVGENPARIVEIAKRQLAALNLASAGEVAELVVGETAERAAERIEAIEERRREHGHDQHSVGDGVAGRADHGVEDPCTSSPLSCSSWSARSKKSSAAIRRRLRPLDQLAEPLLERHLRLEAERRARARDVGRVVANVELAPGLRHQRLDRAFRAGAPAAARCPGW